ncbi:unnamed protein product [Heterobilharzia americana]|nr:unnamed protein product [Heterobilharzia americana]
MEKIREQLSQARLELSDKQTENKGINKEQNKPGGIHCKMNELDDVLLKDVGNRISSSNKLRISLLGALRYGKPFVLDLMEVDGMFDTVCRDRFNAIKPSLLDDIIKKKILHAKVFEYLIKEMDSEEFLKKYFIP